MKIIIAFLIAVAVTTQVLAANQEIHSFSKAKKILDASEFEDYDYSDACLKAYKDYYKEEDLAKKMMQETYDLTTIAISSTDSRLKTNYKLPEPIPIF